MPRPDYAKDLKAALDYDQWLKANPSPDLLELVKRHGGYGHIPHEAWTDFQAASEDWEARRRDRLTNTHGPFGAKNKPRQTGRRRNKA